MKERDFNKPFIFNLPKLEDERGNLSFLEVNSHTPFPITRCYWIYDVPSGQKRGSHAFRSQQEIIICLSGSFDVLLHDGISELKHTLNRSYKALYIPSMTWKTLDNFSTNSVCLVLNSGAYMENEYIRNFEDFERIKLSHKQKEIDFYNAEKKIEKAYYSTVFDCSLLKFSPIKNRAGNIISIESKKNIPFDIQRVFNIYDIPADAKRGRHAHKYCHEILVATTGSFEVELDDGTNKRIISLNNPKRGLHIPPGIWATEQSYSSGATCLALASERYDADGYINSYQKFKKYRENED